MQIIMLIIVMLFYAGCAETELHFKSIYPPDKIQEVIGQFDDLRDSFISSQGEIRLIRQNLWYAYPCLKPQVFSFSQENLPPASPPIPHIELQGDEAIRWWKAQETFHMITPKIGFRDMKQEEIPLLTTIACKISFESHYDQGFLPNLINGPKESQRGTITYISFIFLREKENGDSDRLIDLRRSVEILGADSRIENSWYTRFAKLFGIFFNTGKDALIPSGNF